MTNISGKKLWSDLSSKPPARTRLLTELRTRGWQHKLDGDSRITVNMARLVDL